MIVDPIGTNRIELFALVSYIPGALGQFLDRLRDELVTGCQSKAHVTILPPRSTTATLRANCKTIEDRLDGFGSFQVGLTGIQIFEKSNVIYAALDQGSAELTAMHAALGVEGLQFQEKFPYRPHVTLAQDLDPETVPQMVELATRRWRESLPARTFTVDSLSFVQNSDGMRWIDLAQYDLTTLRVKR